MFAFLELKINWGFQKHPRRSISCCGKKVAKHGLKDRKAPQKKLHVSSCGLKDEQELAR